MYNSNKKPKRKENLNTYAIASPNMLPGMIDLVVEAMIDGDVRVGLTIDPIHVGLELESVRAAIFEVAREIEISVDHFVQQRVDEVTSRSKLEQRLAESNDATLAQIEYARAYRHAFAPLEPTRAETRPKVFAVELDEH